MIRLFVYALAAIVLALLAIVFLDLPADPGYLLIAFGDYTFETSLLALVLAAVVIYLIYRLLRMLLEWINPWQLVRASRRVGSLFSAGRRGKTEEGMLALFRGNWQ
ncbi:MAG: heme biosynthesis protein HemY [Gammaproteobacteria bacterium]|nr:heme biosynthesis protein HemY [Gammaproteobacteria bacterium]